MDTSQQYSTDRVAKLTFLCLLRDFRSTLKDHDFAKNAENAFHAGIPSFRQYVWPRLGKIDTYRFKCWLQLRSWFKRHRFCNDMYSDAELVENTLDGYRDQQIDRATYTPHTYITSCVLREARKVAVRILSRTFDDTGLQFAAIGKRATLGGPLHKAYLDRKLGDPEAFTCPSTLRTWFFNTIKGDSLLQGIVKRVFKNASKGAKKPQLDVDYLKAVLVAKSWKMLRLITPLTLIGLFYTYWVGGKVTEKLSDAKLDIRKLQKKQRRLARKASKDGKNATVDLKAASDSIRSDHLNAVLPRQWYNAVKRSFSRQIFLEEGVASYTEVVLPMGNGCTFPIETLYFYCLIKAVGNLLKVKGTYSVYGDDLIYPSKIHPYVLRVFDDLGLRINVDKTFVDSDFRESCGGDYHQGRDVRPALLPERPSAFLGRLKYAAYLYKVHNSLTRRWDPSEISETLRFLELELLSVQSEILQVPPSYPATAGIKVSVPRKTSWYLPMAKVEVVHHKNGDDFGFFALRFRALVNVLPGSRKVVSVIPYYWDALRSSNASPPDWRSQPNWRMKFKNAPWRPKISMSSLVAVRSAETNQVEYFEPRKDVIKYKNTLSHVIDWT